MIGSAPSHNDLHDLLLHACTVPARPPRLQSNPSRQPPQHSTAPPPLTSSLGSSTHPAGTLRRSRCPRKLAGRSSTEAGRRRWDPPPAASRCCWEPRQRHRPARQQRPLLPGRTGGARGRAALPLPSGADRPCLRAPDSSVWSAVKDGLTAPLPRSRMAAVWEGHWCYSAPQCHPRPAGLSRGATARPSLTLPPLGR